MGRAPDEIIGKSLVEIIGAEGLETIRPYVDTVLRGQPVEYDVKLDLPGIGPRHYHVVYVPERDEALHVIGWIASIIDVTESKKAAEEKERLEKLVAEMRLPAASAQIGIWDWDMRTDIVSCTPEHEAIFGLDAASVRSYSEFFDRVHPEDVEVVRARREAAVKAHRTFQLEFRVIRPNGEIRWVMAVGAAVYDKNTGEPIRIMGNSIDVTERKATEVQAELQRKELMHLMRVATLGGLSGGLAHELNQPLASILANAQAAQQMVARKSTDWERLAETLDDIVQQDERAGQVIRHLRKLLQRGEHREAVISLNELVASTLQLLHSELVNRKIRVDLDLKPALPPIAGDSVELQQVLINLIVNALEAMASTPPSDRAIRIATREANGRSVAVSITDRGPGLSPEDRKRIFEPFFTTKTGGLGLGLSICTTILTAHRGRLTLAKAPGGGTVATVTLPKSEELAIAS